MAETKSNALVLTALPGALLADVVEATERLLRDRTVIQTWWLSPGEAWEALFVAPEDADHAGLLAQMRDLIGARPVDVNIVPDELSLRRKLLLVADMDSTIIGQECIDELADFAGLKPQVAAITERAMRGEIAFEPALRERVALLKGLPVSIIDAVLRERVRLNPGAGALLATMRKHGAYSCLVSGGFTAFTQSVAALAGFDASRGNRLDIADGRLAGTVAEPILGREAKRATLVELCAARGLSRAQTLAVGDGANDLAMLSEAGLGVAFRAKPAVAEAAHARIDHGDLTSLLFLQGYCRSEFVSS